MFIDEKTQNRIHANPGESVSHGTMRTQDLIPAFMDVIRDTPEYVQTTNIIPAHALENKEADWWNSNEATEFLESLFDILDIYSPEGYCFGAHPGDGSDYGYWEKILEEQPDNSKMTLEKVRKEYLENDVCMGELLDTIPAEGLSIEEAFELSIAAKKWADGDRFYRVIGGGEPEEIEV